MLMAAMRKNGREYQIHSEVRKVFMDI